MTFTPSSFFTPLFTYTLLQTRLSDPIKATFTKLAKYLKVKYPDKFYLLRGNHEFDAICSKYGFKKEILNYHDPKNKQLILRAKSIRNNAPNFSSSMFANRISFITGAQSRKSLDFIFTSSNSQVKFAEL